MNTFQPNPPAPGLRSSPNDVLHSEGFYVSYNGHDIGIYGCETTALVLGQMQWFLILNGDHRMQYAAIVEQGLEACLDYFRANDTDMNHRSDKMEGIPERLLPQSAPSLGM